MVSDLHEGMAGTGAIEDVAGVPFGPLNNPRLIDGPRARKTRFSSNFDDEGPNYSSDNSEIDDRVMSDRHDRTSGDMLLDPTYRPRKCHGKLLLNSFAQANNNANKRIASDCPFHFFQIRNPLRGIDHRTSLHPYFPNKAPSFRYMNRDGTIAFGLRHFRIR